jgi:hypothetical protein
MTNPQVVISRIQNRRGTQSEFDALPSPKLAPGEIGMTTDTQRVFIGNADGSYLEFTIQESFNQLLFTPLIIPLPISGTFIPVPGLEFIAGGLLNIIYTVSDTASPSVPVSYSKSGTMTVTCTTTQTDLVDSGIEIDDYPSGSSLTFSSQYASDNISVQILYSHNYPVPLTLSTSTIQWVPF